MAPKKVTTKKSSVTAKTQARRSPIVSTILLATFSIALAAFIHLKGIWWNPFADLDLLGKTTTAQIKRNLHLHASWPGTDVFEKNAPQAWRFLLVLILFFQDALSTQQGQAIFVILTSFAVPLIGFASIEAIKDGRHRIISASLLIFVTGLGQLIMVGAAFPLVFAPLYAYTRYTETYSTVHPLPSPSAWKIGFLSVLNILSIGTIFLTSFTPLHTEAFVWNNILFQFYPVVWLPLLFLPYRKTVASKPGSAAARETPRLNACSTYQLMSYLSVPIYYFGLWWGGVALFEQTRRGLTYGNSGAYLLFWDALGILSTLALIVLIDSYIDEAKISQGARRTHARRLFLEDIIVGTPGALLLGPGWAAARYFQRREILAEKIRFGQKTN